MFLYHNFQDQARSAIETLAGAERQLERSDILPAEREQLLNLLVHKYPKYVEEVGELARAGNTSLTRCRNSAEFQKHPALHLHIAKVRSYFSLADQVCIILRRVRKLAYMKKLAPTVAGDMTVVPEWGGKLRIQAEMEITKCVASAILFHKMREGDRSSSPHKHSQSGTHAQIVCDSRAKRRRREGPFI